MQPYQPVPPARKGWNPWVVTGAVFGAVVVVCLGAVVAFGIGLGPEQPPAVPVLEVPAGLEGRNAAVVDDELRTAGFLDLRFTAQDEAEGLPIWLADWTVVGVEPAAGTQVAADSAVVLVCTKD